MFSLHTHLPTLFPPLGDCCWWLLKQVQQGELWRNPDAILLCRTPNFSLAKAMIGPTPPFLTIKNLPVVKSMPILSHLTVHMVFKMHVVWQWIWICEWQLFIRTALPSSGKTASSCLCNLPTSSWGIQGGLYAGGRWQRRRRVCKEESLNLVSLRKMDNASVQTRRLWEDHSSMKTWPRTGRQGRGCDSSTRCPFNHEAAIKVLI